MYSSIFLLICCLALVQGHDLPHNLLTETGFLRAGGSFNVTEYASHPGLFSKSVEFLLPPPSNFWCKLADLRKPEEGLSIDFVPQDPYPGRIIECHGHECWRLENDNWVFHRNTRESRRFHSSHVIGQELLLVGGDDSPKTAELMPMDGGVSTFHFLVEPPRRRQCSIKIEEDELILTGGLDKIGDSFRLVNHYTGLWSELTVKVELLPSMKSGRANHGCGFFEVGLNKRKVLIVAGGWQVIDGKWTLLESTEVFDLVKSHKWEESTALPTPRTLFGNTIGNTFYAFDGYSRKPLRQELVHWDIHEESWYLTESPLEDREHCGYTTMRSIDLEHFTCIPPTPTTPSPDAVDGGYGQWSNWGVCSQSCDGGKRHRTRKCNNPPPSNGGEKCIGSSLEYGDCNEHRCPVNGGFTEWSEWSDCSQSCGAGVRSKTRTCDNPKPEFGGKSCQGEYKETEYCSTNACPVDGGFSHWTLWTSCTKSCGSGSHSRSRKCDNPAPQNGGEPCLGEKAQTSHCNVQPCPVNGGYGQWNQWSTCDKTCGNGNRFRSRKCNSPEPAHGGLTCNQQGIGGEIEHENCNTQFCPVDGGFGQWAHWSSCTKSCGTGGRERERKCDNPTPQHGGKQCFGNFKENEDCNTNPCPGAGNWGHWSFWTTCPVTCGTGWHTRQRLCDNPPPKHGGADCEGKKQEKGACNTALCPTDGQFGLWSHWGTCSKTCGTGSRSRDRKCDSPAPQNGGKSCFGNFKENEDCNTHDCPGAGNWGQWFPWTTCDKTCNTGWQIRQRLCDSPPPSFGGPDCQGNKQEKAACNTQLCPVNGQFGDWTDWTRCSKSCGIGEQNRRRYCNEPAPANGGQKCHGNFAETVYCNTHECPRW